MLGRRASNSGSCSCSSFRVANIWRARCLISKFRFDCRAATPSNHHITRHCRDNHRFRGLVPSTPDTRVHATMWWFQSHSSANSSCSFAIQIHKTRFSIKIHNMWMYILSSEDLKQTRVTGYVWLMRKVVCEEAFAGTT